MTLEAATEVLPFLSKFITTTIKRKGEKCCDETSSEWSTQLLLNHKMDGEIKNTTPSRPK